MIFLELETAIYILVAVSQMALLIYYYFFVYRKKKQETDRRASLAKEFPYDTLRLMALNIAPGAMLAAIPEGETEVYSVVMDWDMGNDLVTLCTQVTGETNLYVQSGGGIIGAGKHMNVGTAARQFTAMSRDYLSYASASDDTSLPPRNCVKFILLTNNGKFVATDQHAKLEGNTSPLTPLFEAATIVINEMRKSG